jgi:hypothetical protein
LFRECSGLASPNFFARLLCGAKVFTTNSGLNVSNGFAFMLEGGAEER